MREIVVEVEADGRVKVTTKGFRGPSCLAEIEKLKAKLKALGLDVDVERQEKTPEYYQTQVNQQNVKTIV